MSFDFTIDAWNACASGLEEPQAWYTWAAQPELPQSLCHAPLPQMSARQRRRLSPLGRMALCTAYGSQQVNSPMPMVFASQHGDAERSYTLLQDLAQSAPLSPTDFSVSVYHAIAALYAMARQDTSFCTALAAGCCTSEAAIVEASALLADGAPEVLVVVYDAPLPAAYSSFAMEPQSAFAWAWRLRAKSRHDSRFFSLKSVDRARSPRPSSQLLPHGLEVLRFFLSNQRELAHCGWLWGRHG